MITKDIADAMQTCNFGQETQRLNDARISTAAEYRLKLIQPVFISAFI